MLREEGVRVVFGIVDGTYLGLLAGLRDEGIRLITPRHETSAVHMAGAYARLTGKLGVCMASNGPGVANALPGVAVENAEGNRVLLITSTRRVGISYPDRGGTYQYFNQVGTIRAMSKWSGTAQSFARIPELMRRALRLSYRGRPGVVHLDVPENLINGKEKDAPAFWPTGSYRLQHAITAPTEQVGAAADMLLSAKRPMIHAGSGIIHGRAFEELREVAELLGAPVTTSWAARGVLSEDSPLAIPMIHIDLNNRVRNESDVCLVIGSRLGETDWWGKAPYWAPPSKLRLIQVDLDEEVLGMNRPTDLAIFSDAAVFLRALATELKRRGKSSGQEPPAHVRNYAKAAATARKKLDADLKDRSEPMHPAHVSTACREFLPDDAIVVMDGGNTAVWANFYHEVRIPNTVLSTFKFGMLGAGVAQALGAAAAFPDRTVYCLIGDGAFGFHPQEVETAVRNNMKVIFLVYCDRQWGMVKMTQQFAFRPIKTMIKKSLDPGETINADLGEIRFDLLAQSMGALGERVSNPDELPAAIERARKATKTTVIHVDVNPVRHMWAPGLLAFKEMHQEPRGK